MYCQLCSSNGDVINARTPCMTNLMGSTIVSCEQLVDEYGKTGFFFVFSDLACRWTGSYRLKFIVYDLLAYI